MALAAYVPHKYPTGLEPGLEATSFYDPSNFTWPFGTHVAVVEIDPETGVIKLRRYIAVDDCGRVINPLLVDGQIHGGLAQGIAQALYEEAVYDENGQLVSGSLMDYAVPKADDLVNFELDRTERRRRSMPSASKASVRRGRLPPAHDRQRRGGCPGPIGGEASRHAPQARTGVAGDPASPDKEVMAMPAAPFEYHAPSTLQEAIALLTQYDGEAKILAGGHSLLPIMNLRLAQPKALIDIGKIPGLSGIREDNGTIVIGAMTTHYLVESSSLLKQKVPILPETAAVIGDVQVRNRGTIGGSIAHADPAGDLPGAAVALDMQLKAVGPRGERTLSAREFFVDILTTALQPDEILTEIRVPAMAPRTGSAYEKFPNPASRYAIVGAAAVVTLDGNGVCQKASIGLNGVTGTPVAAVGVEQTLVGKRVNDQAIQEASAKAADGLEPLGDIFASAAYRAHLARVFTKRALTRAYGRV